MLAEQINLDFDGTDPEQQLRRRWAENAQRESEFWTPERLCLAYMQGTQPDDSDMRWWAAQPSWNRDLWMRLKDEEYAKAKAERRLPKPFAQVYALWEEASEIHRKHCERLVERFMNEARECFTRGVPMKVDLEKFDPSFYFSAKTALSEALRRVAIPSKCLGIE